MNVQKPEMETISAVTDVKRCIQGAQRPQTHNQSISLTSNLQFNATTVIYCIFNCSARLYCYRDLSSRVKQLVDQFH